MQLVHEALDPSYVPRIDSLAGQIQAGRHSIRERLPSKHEIAGHFPAGRQVRQDLVREGIGYTCASQGISLTAPKVDQQLRTFTSLSHDVALSNREVLVDATSARLADIV